MKTFLTKFFTRFCIFCVCVFAFFLIDHGRSYYLHLIEGSAYNKIPWIYRKINNIPIDSNTTFLMGPSLCLNGLNDSLLTAEGNRDYYNLAINHACNGLTYSILKDIVAAHKPGKVFLSLKFTPYNGIHNMYPLLVSAPEILASARSANFKLLSCIYTKAAWNINRYTQLFKFQLPDQQPRNSVWGQDKSMITDIDKIKQLYTSQRNDFENLFSFQAGTTNSNTGIKGRFGNVYRYLFQKRLFYFDNVLYQSNMLKACKTLLDENKIPFDFILFPCLDQQIRGNTQITVDFYRKNFPEIFNGHTIYFKELDALKSFNMWADAMHLNKQGADTFSHYLLEDIE